MLKTRTHAKIALLSLPPIGEAPGSAGFLQSAQFSSVIRAAAAEQGVDYLPLNEAMIGYLTEKKHRPELTGCRRIQSGDVQGDFFPFRSGKKL